jgi:hypothetical protein
MLEQYWPSVPHVLIEPGVRTGIPLLVDNPKEVGADRIVNCLAAFHKYKSAAIVVDFGSSICVDVVSAKGEFLGGAIAPGVQVSSDAAAARSAALRRIELTRPRSVVGKNTVECMQAGAVFGFARPGRRVGQPHPRGCRRFRRRRCHRGGHRSHRPAAAPRCAHRRALRPAPDPRRPAIWCSSATATARAAGSSRPVSSTGDQTQRGPMPRDCTCCAAHSNFFAITAASRMPQAVPSGMGP